MGVGYAISANQLRNFLGQLKGGRLVDHATLGATVATSADGRVVVSDILESSDAWKRGLRYDDEVVSLAGRSVRTVNAFKNVLGTLPAGWRVPLVYRRGGRREEILVRLAGVHTAAALATIVEGKQQKQADKKHAPKNQTPEESAPAEPPMPMLPSAVRPVYEARRGFTNHHFNMVERDRVARALAADGGQRAWGGRWILAGRLATGEPFRIELSDTEGVIDLPTGTTRVDATGELDVNPSPPGSGGMLAALLLWRRLLREGPEPLGRTSYWGTVPLDPRSFGASAAPRLGDVLESSVAGVEVRFTVGDGGIVSGIELWTTPDADPCEVRFTFPGPNDPQRFARGMPALIEVRHGNELFGEFRVETAGLETAGAAEGDGNAVPNDAAGLPGGGT